MIDFPAFPQTYYHNTKKFPQTFTKRTQNLRIITKIKHSRPLPFNKNTFCVNLNKNLAVFIPKFEPLSKEYLVRILKSLSLDPQKKVKKSPAFYSSKNEIIASLQKNCLHVLLASLNFPKTSHKLKKKLKKI